VFVLYTKKEEHDLENSVRRSVKATDQVEMCSCLSN